VNTEKGTQAPAPTALQERWERLRGAWQQFWYKPIAAERLALVRIVTAVAVLTEMLFQQLPHFSMLYGPDGLAPNGYAEADLLKGWRWTGYFFNTDNFGVYTLAYVGWALVMCAYALGFKTRILGVLAWLFTIAFIHRNFHSKNFGDSVLRVSVFLLMLTPSGDALSWDSWRKHGVLKPIFHAPWATRLFQIQLCTVYAATGISKLTGSKNSTWFDGTALFYVYNDIVLARFAYPLLPFPSWLSPPLSFSALLWEVLFVPLMFVKKLRPWVLYYGVALHLIVFLTVEVGWFGFFIFAWYCAFVPDTWFSDKLYPWLRRKTKLAGEPAAEKPSTGARAIENPM
jgi:hypothetical protein